MTRLAKVGTALAVIFAASLGGLWWRMGAGPINLDIASHGLATALEDNIGHGDTVEVGGTHIERAGRFQIAARIRDIIVRDRDHAIIARAPKAAARLSGSALLRGRPRVESLTLPDAEISVRIAPDGGVTLSAGDNVRPIPDTFRHRTPPNAPTPVGAQSDISFSRLRAEFTWRTGTFVPLYGLKNMVAQAPVLGLFLRGGSNEGLLGVTYDVVGAPDQPVFRVDPLSATSPGVLRKIFEENKNPGDFLPKN